LIDLFQKVHRVRVFTVQVILEISQAKREDDKNHRTPFRDFCEGVPGTGAEQGIRSTAAEGQTGASVFFRQLNQHQQDQHYGDEEENTGQ